MKNSVLKTSVLSLATVILLGMTGCTVNVDDGGGTTTPNIDDEIEEVLSTTITGKAVDGYLKSATVCLDLSMDGYWQDGEPITSTNLNGDGGYSLTVTAAHKTHVNFNQASILVYDGYDSDTGKRFEGKLQAPNDGDSINVTPLTTLVAKTVEKASLEAEASGTLLTQAQIKVNIEAAKVKVKQVLGIDATLDVDADPVALKLGGNEGLIVASLSLQKSVQTLAKAAATDSTKSESALVEDMYEAMVFGLEAIADTDTSSNLELLLTRVEASPQAVALMGDRAVKAVATAKDVGKKIEVLFDGLNGALGNEAEMQNISTLIEQDFATFEAEFETFDWNAVDANFTTAVDLNISTTDAMFTYTANDFREEGLRAELGHLGVADTNATIDALIAMNMQPWELYDRVGEMATNSDLGALVIKINAEKYMWTQAEAEVENEAILGSTAELAFANSGIFYEFRLDEDWDENTSQQTFFYGMGTVNLEQSRFTFVKQGYDGTNWSSEDNDANDAYYEFVNGTWVLEDNEEPFTRNSDSTQLTLTNGAILTKAYERQLSGPTFVNGERLQLEVDMPTGSIEYGLSFENTADSYYSSDYIVNWGGVNITSFDDMITNSCETSWFSGDGDGGFAFASCDTAATSGTLIAMEKDSSNVTTTVDTNAGTWQIKDIGGGNLVLVVLPNDSHLSFHNDGNDNRNRIFALRSGFIYYGELEPAGGRDTISVYNDLAKNAIQDAIAAKVSGSTFTELMLSGNIFYLATDPLDPNVAPYTSTIEFRADGTRTFTRDGVQLVDANWSLTSDGSLHIENQYTNLTMKIVGDGSVYGALYMLEVLDQYGNKTADRLIFDDIDARDAFVTAFIGTQPVASTPVDAPSASRFVGTLPPAAGPLAGLYVDVEVIGDTINGNAGSYTITGSVDASGNITSQMLDMANGGAVSTCTGTVNPDGSVTINATPTDTSISSFSYTLSSPFNLEVGSLTMTGTAWNWQDLIFDANGTLIPDPQEPSEDQNISVSGNILIVDNGAANVKYLSASSAADFNSTIFTSGTVYEAAYIRNSDEIDDWGEPVQDWANGGNPFATLESMITAYDGTNGQIYSNDGFADGGLAFGALNTTDNNGTLIIVDSSGTVVDANAGTYEIVSGTDAVDGNYTAIKTTPTYAAYSNDWHDAFVERSGIVYYGEWSPVDSGGQFYLFDEIAKNDFITWFNANQTTISGELWFGQPKSDWRVEFEELPNVFDPYDFIGLGTIYDLGVNENN